MLQLLTNEPVSLPVDVADLEAYLIGEDDGFYETALMAAGEYFVQSTGVELLTREWSGAGEFNTLVAGGLHPVHRRTTVWVAIPYWPVVSVDSLELDGETVTPEIDTNVKPARVYIGNARRVEMTATIGHELTGSGDVAIDPRINMAILMLAGFIVEHRGACDLTEAASKSGAAMLMNQLKINRVLL